MAMATSYQRSILNSKTRRGSYFLLRTVHFELFELFIFYFLTQSLKGVDFLKLPEQIQPDCNIVKGWEGKENEGGMIWGLAITFYKMMSFMP
jgi:hypothetical protein